VLPISNPANLVLYGDHMPSLLPWLKQFALPSVLSIAATYAGLRWFYRDDLKGKIEAKTEMAPLTGGGCYAAYGIGVTAAALLLASAFDIQLGAPAFAAGAATALYVLGEKRESPLGLAQGRILGHHSVGGGPVCARGRA
jgi:arsenical pump membrane protein